MKVTQAVLRQLPDAAIPELDALAERLAEAITDDSDKAPHENLSDREYEVFILIASGKTLTQIAEQLSLSVATVSTYRARIIEKTNLRSNAEMIRYGLERALVE